MKESRTTKVGPKGKTLSETSMKQVASKNNSKIKTIEAGVTSNLKRPKKAKQ